VRLARLAVLAGATAALVSCGWSARAPTKTSTDAASPATTAPPSPPASASLPWPTYGADAARLRAVPAPGLRPPFRREWTFHGRALLELPPVVGYGSVFEEAFDGRLYALDPATGAIRWRYNAHRCGWASPSLADGLVFASFIAHPSCHSTFRNGELLAFAQSTGRIVWRRRLGPSESSPLAVNGVVYAADQRGWVYAFASESGERLWRTNTGATIKASPTLADGRIFVGDYGGAMLALDASTGRIVWRSGGHGNFYSSAAVSAGRVFAGALDGGVYAFSAGSGAVLWSFPTGGYVYASPAIWRGLVLVGSYDGSFYALHAESGRLAWRFDAHAPISGAASVIDGVVYFSTFAHKTYALAAGSGRVLEQWNDGEYSPAVAGYGRLYLVGLGRIYALEGS
jgi:outer membrane protein assembly factor BamB